MKVVQKRMIAAGCIGVLVIGGAVVVSRTALMNRKKMKQKMEQRQHQLAGW